MKKIELGINYLEDIQLIDETHEITLDNGWEATINIVADVIVSGNNGASYYDEPQKSVEVYNVAVEILEVWNGEESVDMTPTELKELKRLIFENIV